MSERQIIWVTDFWMTCLRRLGIYWTIQSKM